jgi:OmpA family
MNRSKVSLLGVVWVGMAMTVPALADPAGGPTPVGPQTTETTCNEQPKDVEFRISSTRLSPEAKVALNRTAIWAKDDPTRSVRLRGMTDRSGSARTNAKLSERRAAAVKSYLTRLGVDPVRVTTVGHTDDELKDESDNRRAVSVVTCTVAAMVQAPAPPEPMAAVEPVPAPPEVTATPVPAPMYLPAAMPDSPPAVESSSGPMSVIGVGAMVGGGLTGFLDKQARAFTENGPSWDARVTVGTRLPIAVEGAYMGSAQNISALGINDNALIVGQGAEAALRINLSRMAVQPYLFGGAGWTRYQLRRTTANTSSLRGTDDILTAPFGAGLAARVAAGLLLDLRATGRAAFYDDLMDGAYANTGEDARLDSWNLGGRLGWEF